MENKKRSVMEKHIREIVKPIFEKSPKTRPSSSMTTPKKTISIVWRPNNYRRQIEVKEKTNSIKNKIIHTIKNANYTEHTKLISIKNFTPNITLQYGKNTLTGIYSQNVIGGHKETFLIEAYKISHLEEYLQQKKKDIRERIDKALIVFSRQYDIILPLRKPVWSRYEDFLKGEEYIDKIPAETVIHDTYFKKVYGEGIEFIKTDKGEAPTVHLKNYIKNRAIEDLAPDISDSINGLGSKFDDFTGKVTPAIEDLALNMKTHVKIMKNIDKGIMAFNKTVKRLDSRLNQTKLNKWL